MPPVSGSGTVRFMKAPPPVRAENWWVRSKRFNTPTIRFMNGCAMTPTTGRRLCITPMEHETFGLDKLDARSGSLLAVHKAGAC